MKRSDPTDFEHGLRGLGNSVVSMLSFLILLTAGVM